MLASKRLSSHHGKEIIVHYLQRNPGYLSAISNLNYTTLTASTLKNEKQHCHMISKNIASLLANQQPSKRYFSSPNLVSPPPPMFDYILQNQFDKVLERTKTHPHEVTYMHPRGWTALHACAEYGAPINVVKALLRIYPDAIHLEDWKGQKPVDVALLPEVKDFLEGASVMEDAVHVNGHDDEKRPPPLDPNVYDDAVAKGLLHEHPLYMKDLEPGISIDANLLTQEVHDFCDQKSITEQNVENMERAINGHNQKIAPSSSSLDPNVYDGASIEHLHDDGDRHMLKQIDLLCMQVNELTNSCHKLSEEVNALKHHFLEQSKHKEE